MRLRALLGNHPHTLALKRGEIRSDLVSFDFVEYSPTNKGFKPMVREQAFDVAEMAIVTYLMAKSFNKPMALLPAVMMARFQHAYALTNSERGVLGAQDLPGKRVGIRSFTTTTGAWVRGILANDYGVDLDAIRWITFEEPHVAEYVDTTVRAPPGKDILGMLLAGEIDAALGETSQKPAFRPLFPDPEQEAAAWHRRHGIIPVNHLVVVSGALARQPGIVREVFRMLKASKEAAPKPSGIDFAPFGVEPIRRSLETIIRYSAQQSLIPRAVAVDELFDDSTLSLA